MVSKERIAVKRCVFRVYGGRSNRSLLDTMKTELEIVLLEAAKGYLKSLSDEQFLALTCDIFALIVGLVRLVRNESAARNINPTDNTAKTFRRSPRHIRRLLAET